MDGLLSFPLTPFDAADRVDVEAFAEHVDGQVKAGAGAVFVACGTGEFTALSLAEHRTVVETAVTAVAGRVPVFAGAGGGPQLARATLASVAGAGADGALLLPPYLVSSTAEGLLEHVRYVVRGQDVPTIVYQRANAVFTTRTATALLDVPSIIGFKDGIGDLDAMLRIVTAVRNSGHERADSFLFLNGMPTAELSAPAFMGIGVPLYSSAVHCFAPDLAHAYHKALHAGDAQVLTSLLTDFYMPYAELRDTVPGYAVALVKAGAGLGAVRPPLVNARPEHVERLTELVAQGRKAIGA
jgi:5-dehydro-4-deoxyglucarate dehydratase